MKLTKENILHQISSYELLINYLKPYSGGKLLRKNEHILSPFREEKTPSFCIYTKGQNWLWCDHGSGETGSAFDLIMQLHSCDFPESLKIINNDFNLGLGNDDPDYVAPERIKIKAPKEIIPKEDSWYDIDLKEWSKESLEFWQQYGITKLSLDIFRIFPVRSFTSLSGSGKVFTISDYRGPMYAYKIGEDTYKIYRPGQKRLKFLWLGDKPENYIFGYENLPESGNIVFITGGEKDVLTLHSWGFPAVSLNSETATPSDELIADLSSRFDQVVVFYDNDKTGIKQANKIKNNTGLPFIVLPPFEGKDVSDWAKFRNTDTEIIQLLLENLKEKEQSTISEEEEAKQSPEKHTTKPQALGPRSFQQYLEIAEKLHLSPNPDFEKMRDGKIEVSYHEIDGKPYRISGKGNKLDAKRRIGNGNRINAVYIPPAIRRPKGTPKPDFIGTTLFLCQCEVTAWLLSELGLPAVGLPRPDAFLSRPQHRDTHKLINQTMRVLELNDVIYVLPSDSHRLPAGESGVLNPFEHIDSTKNSKACAAVLGRLQQAFERIRVDAVYPSIEAGNVQPNPYWLDEMVIELCSMQPQHWYRDIMVSVHAELFTPADNTYISSISVSAGTNNTFKEILFLNSVEEWVKFHGIDRLGYVFQWGKNVYEYNRKDGSIDLSANSRDSYAVSEYNKRYYVEMKGAGDVPVSDFTMKYHLEVKQEDSFYLVEFMPIRGVSQFSTFHVSEILSADSFKKKVADIPGSKFNFWGSKYNIEQIHAMSRNGVKEAKSLANLLGFDKTTKTYIYGNGLLTEEGDFLDPDENGVVSISDKNYYLPAAAVQNVDSQEYSHENGFQFYESGVDFLEWTQLFIKVHGKQGHMIITFLIASLYRDIFRDQKYEVFPHFSIFAPPDSGKTAIANSLAAFFGKLKQTNLRAGATVASFDRKIALYINSLLILNEFNLSNPQVQKGRLDEYLVGVYDYQAREKTINGKSRQALPNSAIVTIGQEAFWHREALASRCVIQILNPGNQVRTIEERENFNALKDLEKDGISHFNRLFFSQRRIISNNLRPFIENTFSILKDKTNMYATNRMLENWSMILTPLLILIENDLISYPMTKEEIMEYAVDCIEDQSRRMFQEGVLSVFFSFVAAEYGPKKLLGHQDIWLYKKKRQLRIKLATCHKNFVSYLSRENFGIENTSKNDLLNRLIGHPAFLETKKGIQVGWQINELGSIAMNGAGKMTPSATGSLVVIMNYDKIEDFNLPDVKWGNDQEESKLFEYAVNN